MKKREVVLLRIQRFGEDTFFEVTLQKMLDCKVDQDEQELKEIEADLHRVEQQYGLATATFLENFEAGQMGDDVDFLEWISLHRMKERIQVRKHALEGV